MAARSLARGAVLADRGQRAGAGPAARAHGIVARCALSPRRTARLGRPRAVRQGVGCQCGAGGSAAWPAVAADRDPVSGHERAARAAPLRHRSGLQRAAVPAGGGAGAGHGVRAAGDAQRLSGRAGEDRDGDRRHHADPVVALGPTWRFRRHRTGVVALLSQPRHAVRALDAPAGQPGRARGRPAPVRGAGSARHARAAMARGGRMVGREPGGAGRDRLTVRHAFRVRRAGSAPLHALAADTGTAAAYAPAGAPARRLPRRESTRTGAAPDRLSAGDL